MKSASGLDNEPLLIPDEWDLKKHAGHGSGKATPNMGSASPGKKSHPSKTETAPPEDAKGSASEKSINEASSGHTESAQEHQIPFGSTPREHGSMDDLLPDQLNDEEEPVVKPGTMRPKPPPPAPPKPVEAAATSEHEQYALSTTSNAHEEFEKTLTEHAQSGRWSPMSKTYPAMSEHEFQSRVGAHVMMRTHEPMVPKEPIRVLVTAVTTELSYLMLGPLVRGDVFGLDQPIVLHLYDESENISDMHGIAMEMEDCSFGLLKQVVYTGEDEVAFLNVDVAFLNDSVPMDGDRANFEKCVQTYVGHGKALSAHAKKTVKVIVSGHPIETNTYLCNRYAKSIPHENFTGLARLNHNRAVTLLSQKLGVIPNKIVNMIVWGRGGDMLYPDYSRCVVTKKARRYKITDQVPHEYLEQGLPVDVRIREQLVQKLTRHPGLLSRAKAACDQMRDWWIGLAPGTFVTMTVLSDGLYGVPPDVFFSYPVFIDNERTWKVVQGITVDERLRSCIAESSKDLERERDEAMEICTELGL